MRRILGKRRRIVCPETIMFRSSGQRGEIKRRKERRRGRDKEEATREDVVPTSGGAPSRLGKNTERAARASDTSRFRESWLPPRDVRVILVRARLKLFSYTSRKKEREREFSHSLSFSRAINSADKRNGRPPDTRARFALARCRACNAGGTSDEAPDWTVTIDLCPRRGWRRARSPRIYESIFRLGSALSLLLPLTTRCQLCRCACKRSKVERFVNLRIYIQLCVCTYIRMCVKFYSHVAPLTKRCGRDCKTRTCKTLRVRSQVKLEER